MAKKRRRRAPLPRRNRPPVLEPVDEFQNVRCRYCSQKRRETQEYDLTVDHVRMLHWLFLIRYTGQKDEGFLVPEDATRTSKVDYGLLQSRLTGAEYNGLLRGTRTLVRLLGYYGLVERVKYSSKESGFRINDKGRDFLNGNISVPRTMRVLSGSAVKWSKPAVDIKDFGWTPPKNATVPPYLADDDAAAAAT